jgi:4-carboxymuconolactone decarboxylase
VSERLRRIAPEDMSPEQREIYLRFTTGRRAAPGNPFTLVHPDGGLTGPANAWLLSPPLGRALEQLGGTARWGLQLSDRAREIAILVVAYARDSEFEQYAHVPAGRAAGLTEAEIDALAAGREPDLAAPDERAVHQVSTALLARGTLDDAEYGAAIDALGQRRLFELVVLVGYYQLLATQLAVFAVHPPPAPSRPVAAEPPAPTPPGGEGR